MLPNNCVAKPDARVIVETINLMNTSLKSVGKIESVRVDSVISVISVLRFAKKKIHHRGTENTEKLFPTDT